jgi:hypothetical protein
LLPLAERLLGGHLQRHRLDRDLDGWQCDPVFVGKVLYRLYARVARVEVERHRVDCRHGLHVEVALRARPQRDERPHAARGELQASREQRVVHHIAAGEFRPADLDVDARGLRVLLDQLLLLHQHQRQIADPVLLRDIDLAHLAARGERQQCDRGDEHPAYQPISHQSFLQRPCLACSGWRKCTAAV